MKSKVIEKVVFDYLKKQDYKLVDIDERIYFVKNIGDDYADIRFDKEDGWCWISRDLASFLSMMLSTERYDIKNVIGRYVENTLQMKVTSNSKFSFWFERQVENTLQMKVTSNVSPLIQKANSVENTLY
jgi:hypothetical protein